MLQLLRKFSPRAVNAYSTSHSTLHEEELEKFRVIASSWWDINGPFKALHSFNKLRFSNLFFVKTSTTT
jgi:2-polyprenyl-3-methyl-5-hydroxy-6-metoxy-1,4-benzoquinol methylase